ncbi:MAG TPA: hypothetical protein VJ813_00040 [Vicinamibacterales bacterium]|nr:hypothetical protein [Vicinamibacterales bacterium]
MVMAAIGAALFLGAVMTSGDFVWAYFGVRHSMWAGMAHGALMCLCIGAVIGLRAGRLLPGLVAGPLIGVLAAVSFYALASTFGWGAMLPAWMLFWICFALLQRFLVAETLPRALGRGVVAAVLSGLAFYAISGIWTRPSPGGPNYLVHFLYWSFAFLPGFLTLFAGTSSRPASA